MLYVEPHTNNLIYILLLTQIESDILMLCPHGGIYYIYTVTVFKCQILKIKTNLI